MRSVSSLLLLAVVSLQLSGAELLGSVMCGYQGWFRVPADGSNNGWHHYFSGQGGKDFGPGACGIDVWPDVRELPPADRFATPFRFADGSVAEVFSSTRPTTVDVHFRWMKEYGIDGVFLQRFAATARDPRFRVPMDGILDACRTSAKTHGRAWAMMYDLSGLKPGETESVIADWRRLRTEQKLADVLKEPAYLRHRGKPLVALWGIGFNDRAPMLDEWRTLIAFFKDPANGGCAVMLGAPAYWRTGNRDAIADPVLHELLAQADVISPWTVGRFGTPQDVEGHVRNTLTGDLAWCQEKKIDLLPVVFPGFSWHYLQAQFEMHQNELDTALISIQEAARLEASQNEASYGVALVYGQVLVAQGRQQEALRHFDAALMLAQPEDRPYALHELGVAFLDLDRPLEARERLESAAGTPDYPFVPEVLADIAEAEYRLGRLQEAQGTAELALAQGAVVPASLVLGSVEMDYYHLDEALEHYLRVVREAAPGTRDWVTAEQMAADIMAQQGFPDPTSAYLHAQQALEYTDPSDDWYGTLQDHLVRAETLMGSGKGRTLN